MTESLLRRALAHLAEVLDRPSTEREAWLLAHCGGEPALLAEVRRLLAADAQTDGPLDRPLLAQMRHEDDAADTRLGRRYGPYLLRERLGHGGMGDVYLADRDDGGFVQQVALKLLRGALIDDAGAQRRFRRERQILVRLQHPWIARLLDGGISDDGQPWYAMELAAGEPLTRWAQRVQADTHRCLEVLIKVCDAVHYAHQNLVLHRDLKPANVLVDAHDDVRLLDFGIATLLQDDADSSGKTSLAPATRTGQSLFTLDYAAPEQLLGQAVSTAADVYALGVIAYELLCGQRPFQRHAGVPDLAQLGQLPELPSQRGLRIGQDRRRAGALRGDLDTIVLTCLQPEPTRRYASVAALRADLDRYLHGKPIEARPDTLGYRLGKFIRRHRLGVALGAAATVLLLATTAFSLRQMQRTEQALALASANAAAFARERDAALGEVRRQDILREHFVAVLDRASQDDGPIDAHRLLELAADQHLLGEFGDADMQRSLKLALSDLLIQRSDFPRALTLLEAIESEIADRPGRERALVATSRAQAAIPLGRLDEATAAVERAETGMTPEQRSGGILPARLAILRGQLARARGDLVLGAQQAERAAELAQSARDGSALERGAIVGSAATALLQVGDLDGALHHADAADAIWSQASVMSNVSMRTVATVRSNVLFLRGDLLQALALMEANNAAADASESKPARAARDATEAKTLALLARPDEALHIALRAERGMCAALGEDSLDCLRIRASTLDTRLLAGALPAARAQLSALQARLRSAPSPALSPSIQAFALRLALLEAPSAERLHEVIEGLHAAATQGRLARLNARRSLLSVAQALQPAHSALAAEAARAALTLMSAESPLQGMDASLAALWHAHLHAQPYPEDARAALTGALGESHPWLQQPPVR